jgi:predicted dehydrogenase
MTEDPVRVGVVGVGSMGSHHARVYRELPDARLVGVADADAERAQQVAAERGTQAMSVSDLLETVDAVSVAVPTEYHFRTAKQAIEAGVDVLVEKPITDTTEKGRRLVDLAEQAGCLLQVGHVERFNPAVRTVAAESPAFDIIALEATRVGPPVDRSIDDSVVLDLMIHDIDVVLSLVDDDLAFIQAGSASDMQFVTATLTFENGVVASLTASRVTQQKVRELNLTATDCRVNVDYTAQSVEIHRRSYPEYVTSDGDVRHRHESIIEQPTVDNGEPLKAELASFVEAVDTRQEPVVTGDDGVRALEVARAIEQQAAASVSRTAPEVSR